MPEVSIVLPTYNGERYIGESIDSIRNQTFQEWELIIVNDGSSDRTRKIAEEYAKADNRIRVINNKRNLMLPGALNRGFAEAKGKFFTWTSDDNRYLPEALESMHEKLKEEDGLYMVCADMGYIDGSGKLTGKEKHYDDARICEKNFVGACFMYRCEVAREIGGYDEKMRYVEDYDYWLRIRKRYGRIGRIPEVLYLYRQHEDSLSEKKKRAVTMQRMKLREKNIDFILDQLKDKKVLLYSIFYQFMENGYPVGRIKEKIFEQVSELKLEMNCNPSQSSFIIFGAGTYGRQAAEVLKGRAAYFADNDKNKAGRYQCGLQILTFEEMKTLSGHYCVLIAVSGEKIYEMAHQLTENGIYNFCSFYLYMLKKSFPEEVQDDIAGRQDKGIGHHSHIQ